MTFNLHVLSPAGYVCRFVGRGGEGWGEVRENGEGEGDRETGELRENSEG